MDTTNSTHRDEAIDNLRRAHDGGVCSREVDALTALTHAVLAIEERLARADNDKA